MSFLSNPKTAGTALEIVGILQVIAGIFAVAGAILNRDDPEVNLGFAVVIGIGAIVCGCILAFFAVKVRNGTIPAKIDILAIFVRVVGVTTIISSIFTIIGVIILNPQDLTAQIIGGAIGIVIGLIIVFISTKINDGKQTTGDKIIWVLLLVFFVIDIILSVLTIVAGFDPLSLTTIVTGICYTLAYIFMVIMLFDGDVKKEMGM